MSSADDRNSESSAPNAGDSPIITHELLRSWSPCASGFKRYCELFPHGTTLADAIAGLVADGHDEWGKWLFEQCAERKLYESVISRGYMNSGYMNSGDRNSGDWNSGDRNSGDWNSGDWNSGFFNSTLPTEIRVFNKPCDRTVWNNARKPDFLTFSLTKWIEDSVMSDQEKLDNPKFFVAGGYLKSISTARSG